MRFEPGNVSEREIEGDSRFWICPIYAVHDGGNSNFMTDIFTQEGFSNFPREDTLRRAEAVCIGLNLAMENPAFRERYAWCFNDAFSSLPPYATYYIGAKAAEEAREYERKYLEEQEWDDRLLSGDLP